MIKESIEKTGAVIMGRRTFEMADDPDWYAGNYEFQVPIFVVTEQTPEKHSKENEHISFTFLMMFKWLPLKPKKRLTINRLRS